MISKNNIWNNKRRKRSNYSIRCATFGNAVKLSSLGAAIVSVEMKDFAGAKRYRLRI